MVTMESACFRSIRNPERPSSAKIDNSGETAAVQIDFDKIGAAIKAAREAKGWKQDHVGQLAGLSLKTVSDVETARSHAIGSIRACADAVGVGFIFEVGGPAFPEDTARLLAAWPRVPAEFRRSLLMVIEQEAARAAETP